MATDQEIERLGQAIAWLNNREPHESATHSSGAASAFEWIKQKSGDVPLMNLRLNPWPWIQGSESNRTTQIRFSIEG
jgi:hypothetical protein